MSRKKRIPMGLTAAVTIIGSFLLSGCSPRMMVLDPQGPVGREELHLIYLSAILCLVVIVPVLILLAVFVIRYRDKPGNKAPFTPEWHDSKPLEIIWWGVPIVIIGILATVTVKSTFKLTKPPESNIPPVTVQVISLDWKWFFEYPGQGVATVNTAVIPTGVPIQFELTSDAPMNSFWIPQLGGQEYTMAGMADRLWLQSDKSGTYFGRGANFTGKGFTFMTFNVKSVSPAAFKHWVTKVKATKPAFTMADYHQLKKQSVVGVSYYSGFPSKLFNNTIWADGGQDMNPAMMTQDGSGSAGQPMSSMTQAGGSAKTANTTMAGMHMTPTKEQGAKR